MKPKIHVMLCDDIGERFFGEGPCRLLHRIEETRLTAGGGTGHGAFLLQSAAHGQAGGKRIGLCADPQNHWRARRRGQHP